MALGPVIPFIRPQWLDNDGAPLAAGKLYSYLANTSTPTDTYNDSDLDPTHVNTNPVILDSSGRATVYLDPAITYKFVMKDANDVTLWTNDDVPGIIPLTAPTTFEVDGIGSTSTDAAIIINTTAAANASQQWSPRVRWTGSGWNPTASASRVVDVIVQAVPVQQVSGDPVVEWRVSTQINGGGYTERLAITSAGALRINTNKLTADANGNVVIAGGLISDTSTLVVDATNDRVGVGTATPAVPLHVVVAAGSGSKGYFGNGTPYTGSAYGEAVELKGNLLFANLAAARKLFFGSGSSGASGGILAFCRNDSTTAVASLTEAVSDKADWSVTGTMTERSRAFAMGATQTRGFSAGNFTSSSGTWVVGSGDVTTESYRIVGDTMFYTALLVTTSITGTPTTLIIAPPGGATIAEDVEVRCGFCTDGSGATIDVVARAVVSSNKINLVPYTAANFTAGSDTATFRFQLSFKVTGV